MLALKIVRAASLFLLAAALSMLIPIQIPAAAQSPSGIAVPIVCRSYYFFEIVKVVNGSPVVKELQVDVPVNVSLGNIEQRSYVVMSSGVSKGWIVNVSRPGLSYVVALVRVCYPNTTWMIHLVRAFLEIPNLYKNYSVPTKILREYVGKPEPVILNVSSAFVAWLRNSSIPFWDLSIGGLAYRAALFIYWIYIKYSPSAIPHSVEQTVRTRRGDCDDMSRVLTELLWYYDIPALMLYGYVLLNLSKPFAGSLGGVTFVMPDTGPHAFVVAYIPPFGWLSLDLLAGSYIVYPFIIVEVTNNTRVSKEEVREFIELCSTMRGTEIAFALPSSAIERVSEETGIPTLEVLRMLVRFASSYRSPENLSIGVIRSYLNRLAALFLNTVYRLVMLFGEPYPGFIAVARWRCGAEVHLPT